MFIDILFYNTKLHFNYTIVITYLKFLSNVSTSHNTYM